MKNKSALSDVRVIDLTQMLAGPICTQFLADQGATVIKVETLKGDDIRRAGPYRTDDDLQVFGGYFASINRNKSSISVDLKSEAGKELLHRLIAGADILVENFRASVMDRLGFAYETLHEKYPSLVYATVRGFGDPRSGESPYADWPSYDVVAQGMGGIMSITGSEQGPPTKVGPGVGDIVPGLMLGVGILSALHHARRTGQGQFVDVAMTDGILALCERTVYQQSFENRTPGREGNHHPLLCPFGTFAAADGWVSVACPNDSFWAILARVVGREDLVDHPDFATNAARTRNSAAVNHIVHEFTERHSKAELIELLGGRIPFGPVFDSHDIFHDEHFRIRDMIVPVEHPGCKTPVEIAGIPIKMSETPGSIRHRAPILGEHTESIMRDLGYAPVEIARLRKEHIVKSDPPLV